ncbi:MAG: adenylyltransferase/cytidyltransferase family protein [bacterium]|nr:adenylyltransferase/cytidyltransferase family protein [bacterium]
MGKGKRVVVFGIFDGIHDGHRSLFSQAKEHGDELIVIVGRNSASLRWKGKKPRYSQKERLQLVSKEGGIDRVVLGDEEQSSYGVFEELHPDVVCVGYDQDALWKDLQEWIVKEKKGIKIVRLKSYYPKTYHNSKLQR